ncbi:MAG: PD-(D/E)XK nuclease family protein [Pseudomonadota bacterium]
MFSVSAVASATGCMLKAIFQASSHEGALLQGPRAVLGSIAHELVERAIRDINKNGDAAFEELERILGALLHNARERLRVNPVTAHYSHLPRTMSRLAWARKRRKILDLAYESAGSARPCGEAIEPRSNADFRFEKLLRDGRWFEVPIEVPELRLKGRMDILDRRGKETKITDVKSGRVEDENGEIAERIVRQIRLYGLMANWLSPWTNVILTILAGAEHPVPFDADERNETLVWLRSRTDPLPTGSTVSCDSLAQLNSDCRWCDMRHRCLRYLQDTPSLWASNPDWPLPLDVWGLIERIDSKGEDLVDLALWDAGGRHIKVFNLRDTHVARMRAGDRIWLFNLSASATDLRGTPFQHPLNFYEVGDSENDRAWSLQVFTGTLAA